jgi:hypothetical protein
MFSKEVFSLQVAYLFTNTLPILKPDSSRRKEHEVSFLEILRCDNVHTFCVFVKRYATCRLKTSFEKF